MIRILTGTSRLSKSWRNESYEWGAFVALLHEKADANVTSETEAEYERMSKEQRGKVKDVGGYVGGRSEEDGPRVKGSIVARSLVALDIDEPKQPVDELLAGLDGLSWVAHTTHSHTAAHPRWRVLIPLADEVPSEHFERVSRELGRRVGEENLDPSTHQAERLMYWPSCCRGASVEWREGSGETADPARLLSCTSDEEWAQTFRDEFRRNRVAQDGRGAGDPRQKPGIIGAFCRAYTVPEAIARFIPSVYRHDRGLVWTYTGGSSYGGMRVFDADGLWCYSHHATDPAGGRALNAFDLVRIHLFGRDELEGVPMNRQPGFVKMEALCRADERVAPLIRETQPAADAFDSLDDTEGGDELTDLKNRILSTDKGKPTPQNLYTILTEDPRLRGRILYNEFASDLYVADGMPWPWPEEGCHRLEDPDYDAMSLFLSANYGMHTGQERQVEAMTLVARRNTYNPLTDYLDGLEWDGVCRVETLLHDALGADDTPIIRRITRMHLAAAVARAYEPGCKYDHILTLHGKEGTGKSSFLEALGGEWYNNRGLDPKDKDTVIGLRGNWIIEVGEMMGYKTSEVEAWKSFLTTRTDKIRLPFARRDSVLKRQCVFFATTNEDEFLKGANGDRRFLPIECKGTSEEVADIRQRIEHERDQIWAEAVQYYRDGEQLYLSSEETEQVNEMLEGVSLTAQDYNIGLVCEIVVRAKPWNWYELTPDERHRWWTDGQVQDEHGQDIVNDIRPRFICRREISEALYGSRDGQYTSGNIGQWLKIISKTYGIVTPSGQTKQRFGARLGVQAAYPIDWGKADEYRRRFNVGNGVQKVEFDDDLL